MCPIFCVKIFSDPLASPRGSQISLNAPIGPEHDEKKFPKNSGKHIFGYIIYGENFLRENFSPQYPLASPRGSQISLNAPIGPQHDEKKLSEKFQKNYFRIYNLWGKFFTLKFSRSVPPSVPQGLTNIPKCPHRATTR